MSMSWTSHARELQRSVFPSLSFVASAGPSLKSTTRTTRTISLTQKNIQKCLVLASSTTGVFSPWRPASSKAVVRCTLQKANQKLTEADLEVNTLKIYEKWWNMIANNHTELKETKQQNSTHCCMLLATSPTSMIWSVPVTSFNGLLHLSFSCAKLAKTCLPELELSLDHSHGWTSRTCPSLTNFWSSPFIQRSWQWNVVKSPPVQASNAHLPDHDLGLPVRHPQGNQDLHFHVNASTWESTSTTHWKATEQPNNGILRLALFFGIHLKVIAHLSDLNSQRHLWIFGYLSIFVTFKPSSKQSTDQRITLFKAARLFLLLQELLLEAFLNALKLQTRLLTFLSTAWPTGVLTRIEVEYENGFRKSWSFLDWQKLTTVL